MPLSDLPLSPMRARWRAAAVHVALSAVVATLAALFVFGIWYPGAYRLLAGGQSLFVLVTSVDLVLGPLLTLVVFDIKKSRAHLWRDLMVIGLLQLAGLAYGLHTVWVARPVAMVFEIDRFRVLSEGQIRLSELPRALPAYRTLSWRGPVVLGTRKPVSVADRNEALFAAVDGFDIGQRPLYWQPYAESVPDVLQRSRPVSRLLDAHEARRAELTERIRALGVDLATVTFLPVIARGNWVAILDPAGQIAGFLPVDGFV